MGVGEGGGEAPEQAWQLGGGRAAGIAKRQRRWRKYCRRQL